MNNNIELAPGVDKEKEQFIVNFRNLGFRDYD